MSTKRFILSPERKRYRLDQNIFVFVLFLLISILFWFLNELNKVTETVIPFQVRYTNVPKGKVLANELPPILNLRVEGPGNVLLRYTIIASRSSLVYNLRNQPFGQIANTDPPRFYVLTSSAREMLNRQLPEELNLLQVTPDTIFLTFDNMVSKKVRVVPVLDLQFDKQFMLRSGVVVKPDSVMISGPAAVIDTLLSVQTEPIVYRNLNESVETEMPLHPVEKVILSTRRVTVSIPVSEYTEAVYAVPVEVIHEPDSLVMKVFPGKINITCLVGLEDYPRIQPQMFRVTVDYRNYLDAPGKLLKASIDRAPEYVRIVRLHPQNVEFIIEKK